MWSSALNFVNIDVMAAIPEEKAYPCLPFSRTAINFSSFFLVGFETLPYSKSCSFPNSSVLYAEAILIVLFQSLYSSSIYFNPCIVFVSNFIYCPLFYKIFFIISYY